MNQMKYVEGDLFESLIDDTELGTIIIPHVCNNQGKMGAGFVIPLAQAYPDAKTAYTEWHRTNKVPHLTPHRPITHSSKDGHFGLGQVQFVSVVHAVPDTPRVVIANMIAQTLDGKRPLSYKYLTRCMDRVRQQAERYAESEGTTRIVFPLFGGKLAGGNWNFIEHLVQDYWHQFDLRCHYLARFLDDSWTPPENGIVEFETRP